MKKIGSYLIEYLLSVDKRVLSLCTFFTALAIYINYYHGLSNQIYALTPLNQYLAWLLVFLSTFAFGYATVFVLHKNKYQITTSFLVLLLLAPVIFSWKMMFNVELNLVANPEGNAFWNRIVYWPLKLSVITISLWMIWRNNRTESFYGLSTRGFSFKPYLLMLLIMAPLVAAASTQTDFLATYPKLKHIAFLNEGILSWWQVLLFELSYGSDFFTIELFFRGFLVLAFVRWFGKDAILPMAMFYCTIHFGKPLGECISSFLGGIILGVVTYHTRSILGGLMVHLGIAWMMELGGYLGNLWR